MNLLILGAGGHGRVVAEIALLSKKFDKISFLDDDSTDAIGKLDEYDKFKNEYTHAFVALGNSSIREKYISLLKDVGYEIPILIHPSAIISDTATISNGTVVMANAIIQPNVRLGEGCIISAGAICDHDSMIHDYCHINAGAIVSSMSNVPKHMKVDYGEVYWNV